MYVIGKTALAALVATVATIGAGAGQARARSHDHIDRLAVQMQSQFRSLHREVDRHCRHTPQYRHLHGDVARMEGLARHIHEVAHHGGALDHIRADLRKLDDLYHHIEHLLDDLDRSHRVGHRTIRHLRYELGRVGRTLHHLRHDLR